MPIKQKDIKLLWGRAASRCAVPDCREELSLITPQSQSDIIVGEVAHIVAKENDGPRGESPLTPEDRDSYENLILLCPNHHTLIDQDVETYTIEVLHSMKSKHETWVKETLSNREDFQNLARELVYADLIDAAVEGCSLENWEVWTSYASGPWPSWDDKARDRARQFYDKIFRAVWPCTMDELERALKTLSHVMMDATIVFWEHSEVEPKRRDRYNRLPIAFHQDPHLTEDYDKVAQRFLAWLDDCHLMIFELAKAANWFADVVRRDVNPLFFAAKGRFVLIRGPFSDMSIRREMWDYTEEERTGMPYKPPARLERKPFDEE